VAEQQPDPNPDQTPDAVPPVPDEFVVVDGTELPDAAANYVRFVENALGVPVSLVGTGQGREAVLTLP